MYHLCRTTVLLALFASLPFLSNAHTWVEDCQVISPNGSYIGEPGYPRGYVDRESPDFQANGDANVVWLLPSAEASMPNGDVRSRINSSDLLCTPYAQTKNYTNPAFPKLKVNPGSWVAMKYLENGHVTLPWNVPAKPYMGGTVYVFGTTRPRRDEKLADVLKWDKSGTGGDKRGALLATQNYDDGRCHQINSCVVSAERQVLYPLGSDGTAEEMMCESDFQVPDNQPPGDLTIYWVWQWPTPPNKDCGLPMGKDEYYTSCLDFEVNDAAPGDIKAIEDEPAASMIADDSFKHKAVASYKARTAAITSRPVTLDDWHGSIDKRDDEVDTSFLSECSVSAEANPAPTGLPPSCPAGKWATGALFASISKSVLAAQRASPTADLGAAQSSAAPATSQPAPTTTPTGSPENAVSTLVYTTTLTTIVTETSGMAPNTPPAQPEESKQPNPNHYNFNTISTIGAAGAASSGAAVVPTVAADGGVYDPSANDSKFAAGHIARHRLHARQF